MDNHSESGKREVRKANNSVKGEAGDTAWRHATLLPRATPLAGPTAAAMPSLSAPRSRQGLPTPPQPNGLHNMSLTFAPALNRALAFTTSETRAS